MATTYTYKCKRHGSFQQTMGPSEQRKITGRSVPCQSPGCGQVPRLIKAEDAPDVVIPDDAALDEMAFRQNWDG